MNNIPFIGTMVAEYVSAISMGGIEPGEVCGYRVAGAFACLWIGLEGVSLDRGSILMQDPEALGVPTWLPSDLTSLANAAPLLDLSPWKTFEVTTSAPVSSGHCGNSSQLQIAL
jgi:hypothetical protein